MSASPILFVPGLNCTGEVFAPQIAALGPRYACLVADHTRGRTIGEIAQEILARAPERFALAGFSLGGYIAFEMLRQAPSRVERLALLSTQATPESDVAREKAARACGAGTGRSLHGSGTGALAGGRSPLARRR